MKEKSKGIKEKFLDMMELPKELILDIPRTTILGHEDVLIENYGGMIVYEENIIKFSSGISVLGEALKVEEITDEEVMIQGKINTIEFQS